MNKQKISMITGITGQDGSYLAEFLLFKGYKVVGLKRRTSTINTERIDHIYNDPNFVLEYYDLNDVGRIWELLLKYKPDEFYSLGAQSHVKVSFDIPEHTVDGIVMGTLRILNAIKSIVPECRLYQASSSEMFGINPKLPLNEKSTLMPASPYAVAKVAAHNMVDVYRKSYGLHASSGILMNHETMAGFMPILFSQDGFLDIKPISEVVKYHTNRDKTSIDEKLRIYQETDVSSDLYVWDFEGWTKVKYASGYPSEIKPDANSRFIVSKSAAYMATGEHVCIMNDGTEKKTSELICGDKIHLVDFPQDDWCQIDFRLMKLAKLAGFIVGDGYISEKNKIKIVSKNKEVLEKYSLLWESIGGHYAFDKKTRVSGFGSNIFCCRLLNNKDFTRNEFYTESKHKRIPSWILNVSKEIQRQFLEGYNDADGLKSDKRKCIFKFRNFKTNSATLAFGLIYLVERVTGQKCCINLEFDKKWGNGAIYYSINFLSNAIYSLNKSKEKCELVKKMISEGVSLREINRKTAISRKFIQKVSRGYIPNGKHHFKKEDNEIKQIHDMKHYDGWFYDLETESGTFNCGIGRVHVHNSPRRGETFITRKITLAAARIKLGLQDKLVLGNLEAKRDWGYAKDFVEAMWLMLQQDKPDDYVIATGEMHTVREFLNIVFNKAGLSVDKHVIIDPKYFRPQEVPALLGDPSKAKAVLGWEPKIRFEELANKMYEADLDKVRSEIKNVKI